MKSIWTLWLLLLLVPFGVWGGFRDRKVKRRLGVLLSLHDGTAPDLPELNAILARFNKEVAGVALGAEERANLTFRGHRITVARGQVGFSIIRRIGAEWATSERVFALCSPADKSWAKAQRDVFQKIGIGSELAAFWVKDVLTMADEMEGSNHTSNTTPLARRGSSEESRHLGQLTT